MGKFYQSIQSNGPSFMTKFCSALYLENLLTNIFAKLNLRGGVSCMPAALLFNFLFHASKCGKLGAMGDFPNLSCNLCRFLFAFEEDLLHGP